MTSSESRDYVRDPTLSLAEKLRRHVKNRPRSPMTSNLMSTDPVFMNKWGPWVLLFVLCGAGTWGTLVAMPVLYVGCWEGWLVLGRIFVGVMIVEATVNWSLTRWVSNEYNPAVHGTQPSDFALLGNGNFGTSNGGENEKSGTFQSENNVISRHESGGNDSFSGGSKQNQTDDASKINMCEMRGGGNATDSSCINIESGSDGGGGDGGADVSKPRVKNTSYDGYSYKVLVAVALPRADGHVERKSYPYWSWVSCLLCQRPRPPRCHHCTLCQMCVLKRDHHCYMTGACIGANNQRFFLVFLVWGVTLALFGTLHMLPYTFYHVVPDYNISIFDFLPPVSLIRGLLGYISLVIVLLCVLFWLLLFFVVFSTAMLFNFCNLLVLGQTSFEHDNRIKVTDTRSMSGKLLSVFGRYWWLNFLVPTYPWITPAEDAVLWPHIKPY